MVAENKCLKFDNDRLEAKVKQNVQQSNSRENYSRRNNIVLRGIVKTDNETNEKYEEVKIFLLNKLNPCPAEYLEVFLKIVHVLFKGVNPSSNMGGGDNIGEKYTSRLRDVMRGAKRRALFGGFGGMLPREFF